MTAQSRYGGYPGLRRPTSPTVSTPDLRGGRPLRFPANDPIYRNSLPASETFVRGRTVRDFGKKVPGIVDGRAASHIVGKGFVKFVPYLGTALTLYEVYEAIKEGAGTTEIPRDPLNEADMQLSFPANWSKADWTEANAANREATYSLRPFTFGTTNRFTGLNRGLISNEDYATPDWPEGTTAASNVETMAAESPSQWWVGSPAIAENPAANLVWVGREQLHLPGQAGNSEGLSASEVWVRGTGTLANPSFSNSPRIEAGGDAQFIEITAPVAPRWHQIPGRVPNPSLTRAEQTERGNSPQPRYEAPAAAPSPFPGVGWVPAPIIIGQPYSPTPTAPTPRGPPPPGTKEQKVSIKRGGVVQFISRRIGDVTELLDGINAFYYALPPQYRPGYYKLHKKDGSVFYKKRWNASQAQRAAAVYRHFDKIVFTDALKNLAMNEIQDRAIGKVSQWHQKSDGVQRFGNGRSFQFGPWDTGFG